MYLKKRLIKNKIAAQATEIDLRTLQVEQTEMQGVNTIKVNSNNGEQLGYFDYKVVDYDYGEGDEEHYIYILNVQVYPQNRNLGIGQILYKEFGNVYSEKYNGFELKRDFLNPIAEYAYRKAVGLGYIPESTLVEEKIRRDYSEADEDLIGDLRNKLPENVQGPENWASKDRLNEKLSAVTTIDARNLVFELNDNEDPAGKPSVSRILNVKLSDGTVVGAIMYEEIYVYSDRSATEIKESYIYITYITVFEEFKNNGIGLELYKEFGKIYDERYNGWTIKRNFIEPVAEYLYRKAVGLGYFPEATLDEKNIKRTYINEDKKIKDLRKKLPKNVQGPRGWQ